MDEIIRLFGAFDENLKVIEAETGAAIRSDSESIIIEGEEEAVQIAASVVEKLLALIRRDEKIDRGRIRYAIDLAREGNSDLILELADDVIAFTNRGKQIKCKTIGQKRYINALKRRTVVFGVGPAGTGKTYLAVAEGIPAEQEGRFEDLLFKDSRKNKSYVVKRERKGVRKVSLDYRVLAEADGKSLVKVRLNTGRSHQIRVQFASRKMPLAGDGKYGSRDNRCTVALWSAEIEFSFNKEKYTFESKPDFAAYPWNLFNF